jgi:DNA-binding MarR family transcriptional regulator/GNAT superfamily N-acetyltransferase
MDAQQIQRVRRFNRTVTQRVGALEDSYLRRGRPLGEARVVFEIGPDGADVRTLRDRLGLDSGYFSRLLRSLEAEGLITVGRQPHDGRRRHVRLTARGETECTVYDGLSNELAKSMLASLEPGERARLVAAMTEVERLLRRAALAVQVEPPDSADAVWCLRQYFQELAVRFDAGFDPARSNPARDEEMRPPAGWFVVARLDGDPVGCGALKRRDQTVAEIKRMWTAPSARGQGIARRVLATLETIARDVGLTTLRLETNRTLKEAQALYRHAGYQEVTAFNDEPYAHHWFEKQL